MNITNTIQQYSSSHSLHNDTPSTNNSSFQEVYNKTFLSMQNKKGDSGADFLLFMLKLLPNLTTDQIVQKLKEEPQYFEQVAEEYKQHCKQHNKPIDFNSNIFAFNK